MRTIRQLVDGAQVLVCCGAGGVGKTTVATALALAAAREGRRVLALTVDPSRRLAQTLGVSPNLPRPAPVPAAWRAEAGIPEHAVLDAWMLAPRRVADRVVRRFTADPDQQQRLMGNRIYAQMSRMVAGMQEYTAMQAVHDFLEEGRYDLIVLDTPPSRNALDFLDGPRKLRRFLDGRIYRLFLPGDGTSAIRGLARQLIRRVLNAALGEENATDLQEFFLHFGELFSTFASNAVRTQQMLADDEKVGFVLITSPAPESVTDAMFFRRKTEDLGMPFVGFVLNRSFALASGRVFPDESLLGSTISETERSALAKLQALAELERAEMQRDQQLLAELDDRAGDDAFARALPALPGGVDDMEALLVVADTLIMEPGADEAADHGGEEVQHSVAHQA